MATQATIGQQAVRRERKKRTIHPATIVINAILLVMVVLTAIPYIYMALSAFKENSEIFGEPLTLWPRKPTLQNMVGLLDQAPYLRWYLNTAIVALLTTLSSVLLASLAGFAFAKYEFRFKNLLFTLLLATILVPFQVLLVPQFQIIRTLGWFNTYQALVVPHAVGAFGIFLMRQYTLAVPNDLLDAGRIDGASEFGLWWRVVLPIVRPGLAVLAILAFTANWNDFFWPMIVTTETSMFVINLGLAALVGPYDYQYGILLSGALLASLPVIIVFLIFQRQFIEGLTAGAVKGG